MRNIYSRLFGVLFALLLTLTASAENEIYYGYYHGTGTLTGFGTKKAETYDIALHLTDPMLVGMEIRGLRIPVRTDAGNASDYKGWLTTELTLASGKFVPDIVSVETTPSGTWAEIRLAEPYIVGEGGVYAGYSFTVTSVDTGNDSDPNKTPVQTIAAENPEGLLIHTSRTYRKWVGLADSGSPALVVIVGGEAVKERAATLQVPNNLYTLVGNTLSATLTLVNHGTESIKNIEYEIVMNGETVTKTLTKSLTGGYYGRSTTFTTTIPAANEPGTCQTVFRVTKVNGEPNEDRQPETVTPVVYLEELPLHKPLVEEYTGTWCQYCPRALAGMEKMTDKNGENFVGVAYHVLDEMSFTPSSYLPADPSGLPSVFIDRVAGFNPLEGQSEWEKRRNIIAPATLTVIGEWADESKTKVRATSTTTFIRDFKDNPYRIGYILIANDVHHSGWSQSNALSGESTTGDAYIDKYRKGESTLWDLHYNEVAMDQSAKYGAGLEESLPTDCKGNIPYTHEFTFDVSSYFPFLWEHKVEGRTVEDYVDAFDKEKLEVVAVLIDTTTGEVMNCNKGHVTENTGVLSIDNVQLTMDHYYDLSGRKVKNPRKGIYIKDGKKVIK